MMKRLRAQVAYQRSKGGGLLRKFSIEKEKMKEDNDDKHYIAVKKIVGDSQKREKKAVFLRHQIQVYGSKRPCYSEEVVRECEIWRFLSSKGYDHARKSDLLTLPAKCTLHQNRMFLALLDNIVAFFETAAKHFPRIKVHEVLQLLVALYHEQSRILNCPDVGNCHARRTAGVIADKFVRLL